MDAIQSSDSDKWLKAMKSEMKSMEINNVWTLIYAPKGIKTIGCKWIFKRKWGTDGQVKTYKAYLVVKRYCQHYDIDYDEIFFSMAMLKSIRIMLTLAIYLDYEIQQKDVQTIFLNGEMEEEVHMI